MVSGLHGKPGVNVNPPVDLAHVQEHENAQLQLQIMEEKNVLDQVIWLKNARVSHVQVGLEILKEFLTRIHAIHSLIPLVLHS